MLCAALDAVGPARLPRRARRRLALSRPARPSGSPEEPRGRILHELATRDFVGLERELGRPTWTRDAAALLLRVPQVRGGAEVLDDAPAGPSPTPWPGCGPCRRCSPPEVAERVIFDLGLSRGLGYYTGAVFEVYDPALGAPLGGGGRYDDLLGRFGRPLPAVGFALNVERLHIALAGEEGSGEVERPYRSRSRAARCSPSTLDLLDRLGVDTAEVRVNDRKLLFADAGLITMRPSDVPTYVEAGAADLGITGKDVLMEQSERDVYELLDLGYGRCRMVLATVAGEDRRPRRCAGSASCGSRPSTRASPATYFEHTGRQAEIVEVKGSVELAPLTGLVEGIVDLTATGTTLAQNGLVVREEIAVCTARLIANPVAHKLKAQAIDDVLERLAWRLSAVALGVRRWPPRCATPATPDVEAAVREIVARVRGGGRRAPCSRYTRELDTGGAQPWPLRVEPLQLDEALDALDPARCATALELAAANVRAVALAGMGADREVALPQGQTVTLREVPVRRAAVYVPGRAGAVSQHRRDGRRHGAGRRRGGGRRVLAAARRRRRRSRRARRVRAVRGRRGLPRWAARRRWPRWRWAPRRCPPST